MRKLLCFWLCLLSSILALDAKTYAIRIPQQTWLLVVDTPPLTPGGESNGPGGYSYRASSGTFNLSVLVAARAAPQGGNKECYEYYWAKTAQNPTVKKDTIKVTPTPAYYRVEYIIDAGAGATHRNVDYYFAREDRWVDVHISVRNPIAADEAIFAKFDKALRVTSAGGGSAQGGTGVQVLRLSETDALNFTVPAQWVMGVVETPTKQFPYVTFPFYPKDGRKAACLLTVFSRYDPDGIRPEMLQEILVGESKPLIDTTAQKKMPEIHVLKFAHGYGLSAQFIDARLVGKPAQPTEFKVVTLYTISVQGPSGDYLLKVSVLVDDASSSEFREADAMIKSLAEAK